VTVIIADEAVASTLATTMIACALGLDSRRRR
jgi:hypothetical protein